MLKKGMHIASSIQVLYSCFLNWNGIQWLKNLLDSSRVNFKILDLYTIVAVALKNLI